MINYAISTFNVIVVIGKVEAKVEKFRRRSTGKGSGGGKHSLVLTFCLSQDPVEFGVHGRREQGLKIVHDPRIFKFSTILLIRKTNQ